VQKVSGILILALLLSGSIMSSFAHAQEPQIQGAFSEELISKLGLPLVEVHVGPDGVEAPSQLAPGSYHIRLSAADGFIGYMNIVQPPAGLDQQTEEEQMLAAGVFDLPQEGWTYFGGTNTPELGESASFVIQLGEGDYKIAASYYTDEEGNEEVMRLVPLVVSAKATPVAGMAATPTPGSVDDESAVTLEMTDDPAYIVSPGTVPAGPQIWRFENTGTERSHHVVIFRIPDGVTEGDILAGYEGLMMGTPPAEDSLVTQMVWTGYGAIQSPGTVTWAEFDLEPGTYAVICYIMDDVQSMPHFMDGMITIFTVE
jgi:hypothetical protein